MKKFILSLKLPALVCYYTLLIMIYIAVINLSIFLLNQLESWVNGLGLLIAIFATVFVINSIYIKLKNKFTKS